MGRDASCCKCDKCDGIHPTDQCPWFRTKDGTARTRTSHPDAVPLPQDERPPLLPNSPSVEVRGEVEQQPEDGSCLYHSLRRGEIALGRAGRSARTIRQELAEFCRDEHDTRCSGKTLDEWLVHERGDSLTMGEYTRRQAKYGWGGSLEILSYMLLQGINVWIWVPIGGGVFRRTTCFNVPPGRQQHGRINLSYEGGAHYNWLLPNRDDIVSSMQVQLNFMQRVGSRSATRSDKQVLF
jgi:hypothetical protein